MNLLLGLALIALPQEGHPVLPTQIDSGFSARFGRAWTGQEITTVAAHRSGRVAVLDARESAVYIVDGQGRILHQFGRTGRGPGEFLSPSAAGFLGDTLWVVDRRLGRVTTFSLDGAILGTRDAMYRPGTAGLLPTAPGALLEGGSEVVEPSLQGGVGALPELPRTLIRIRLPRRAVDTLRILSRVLGVLSDGKGTFVVLQPFADGSLWRASTNGQWLAIVDRKAGRPRRTARFSLVLYSSSWQVRHRTEVPYSPVALPARIARSLILDSLQALSLPEAIAREFATIAPQTAYIPGTYPPVTGLIIGTDGTTWLRREQTAGAKNVAWLAIGACGRQEGVVSLPVASRVVEATREALYVVRPDADGLPVLSRYRLPSPISGCASSGRALPNESMLRSPAR